MEDNAVAAAVSVPGDVEVGAGVDVEVNVAVENGSELPLVVHCDVIMVNGETLAD